MRDYASRLKLNELNQIMVKGAEFKGFRLWGRRKHIPIVQLRIKLKSSAIRSSGWNMQKLTINYVEKSETLNEFCSLIVRICLLVLLLLCSGFVVEKRQIIN